MPISTVSYITLNGNDKIGLSDTLDNYTIDEIKTNGYVGAYDPLRTNCYTAQKKSMWSGMEEQKTPYKPEWTGTPFPWSHKIYAGDGTYTGETFIAVVWLYRTIEGLTEKVINETNISNYKLVTEMPANKMFYTVPDLYSWNAYVCATSWNDERTYPSSYYAPGTGVLYYHSNYGNTGDTSARVNDIYPYMMFEYDGYLYFQLMTQQVDYYASWMINSETTTDWDITPYGSSTLTPFTEDTDVSLSTSYNMVSRSIEANSLAGCNFSTIIPYDGSSVWAGPANYNEVYGGGLDANNKYLSYYCYGGTGKYYSTYRCFATLATKTDSLLYFANSGVHIIADKAYKPIINDGVVTGFTDDLTTPSDLDDWDMGATNHGINPSNPPTPSAPTGDDEIDMPLAYIGGTAGMVDFIKINETGLASADDIADAISRFDITTIGKDLLRNFVAFKCYAVLNIDDSVVRDIKVSGHTLKDENDHALQGEYIGGVAPVDFSAGTIEHLYNDYRDYAPYTRIQMYVPFCGWFDLPSWCMGKDITGTMFTDLYNGTVKAVIYASKTVVAEVGGCCAFDIPFAAESTGMKAGAVISSALNTVAMTGATIAAPNIATGIAAASSAANFVSAANSNGTTLKGVMGDGSNTNGLLHVYIKTTRPNSPNNKKAIPDKYKHEYGIPCYKELKLTAGDGYTQILDANITGSMTDREKQMIIEGFRHGLIL